MSEQTVVYTLPVLPLKSAVLFPYLLMPLSAGRPSSIAAVEAALATESKEILIFTQRDADGGHHGAQGSERGSGQRIDGYRSERAGDDRVLEVDEPDGAGVELVEQPDVTCTFACPGVPRPGVPVAFRLPLARSPRGSRHAVQCFRTVPSTSRPALDTGVNWVELLRSSARTPK